MLCRSDAIALLWQIVRVHSGLTREMRLKRKDGGSSVVFFFCSVCHFFSCVELFFFSFFSRASTDRSTLTIFTERTVSTKWSTLGSGIEYCSLWLIPTPGKRQTGRAENRALPRGNVPEFPSVLSLLGLEPADPGLNEIWSFGLVTLGCCRHHCWYSTT